MSSLGHNQRLGDQLGEALSRVCQVLRLIARDLADDQDAAVAVEPMLSQRAQPRLHTGCQRRGGFEIEAELDLARYLVDVLAAGPRSAHRRPHQLTLENDDSWTNDQAFQAPANNSIGASDCASQAGFG